MPNKKLSLSYWFFFLLAIVSLTQFFGAHTYFAVNHDGEGFIVIGLSIFGFISSMIFMSYKIYAEEKLKDNLRVKFEPYEKLYEIFADASKKQGNSVIKGVKA